MFFDIQAHCSELRALLESADLNGLKEAVERRLAWFEEAGRREAGIVEITLPF